MRAYLQRYPFSDGPDKAMNARCQAAVLENLCETIVPGSRHVKPVLYIDAIMADMPVPLRQSEPTCLRFAGFVALSVLIIAIAAACGHSAVQHWCGHTLSVSRF